MSPQALPDRVDPAFAVAAGIDVHELRQQSDHRLMLPAEILDNIGFCFHAHGSLQAKGTSCGLDMRTMKPLGVEFNRNRPSRSYFAIRRQFNDEAPTPRPESAHKIAEANCRAPSGIAGPLSRRVIPGSGRSPQSPEPTRAGFG